MASMLDGLIGMFRRKRVGPTDRAGVHGFTITGGYLDEEEINAKLRGTEKYKTYSNLIANVSIVGASVRYFVNLVARAKWTFEPSDSDSSGKFAELTEKALTDDPATSFHRIVRRSSMYRMYGFGFQEWTMRRDEEEGHWTYADIEPRPQKTIERWDVDETGSVQGVFQRDPNTAADLYLPRNKLVYIVDDTLSDSPDGMGIFRHLVQPGTQLSRFEQLEGMGFETDLRGMPLARAPLAELEKLVENGTLKRQQVDEILSGLKKFVQNHIKTPNQGLLLDSMTYQTVDERGTPSAIPKWDVQLITGGSTTQEAVAKAIDRKSREIARLLGTESIMLGDSKLGSHALSRDKTQNLWLVVDGALLEIGESYDADLIDPLFKVNGWPIEMKPTIKHESVQFKDVAEITAALRDMATAGGTLAPDDPVLQEVRSLLGLESQVVPFVPPDDGSLMGGGGDPANPDGGGNDPSVPDKPGDGRRQ